MHGYPDCLAHHYDTDYEILRRDAADVGFYGTLAAEADGPVCEVACGTGRVALPAARSGAVLTGVDPTRLMLERFAEKLAAEPAAVRERVTLVEGHFHDVPLPDAGFALVFSAFRAFQHLLDQQARAAALVELARLLRPGGLLAFDCFDYDLSKAAQYRDEHSDYLLDVDGVRHERRSQASFDPERRVIAARFRWLVDGETVDEGLFEMAAPTRDELVGLLPAAGLELVDVFGDFDRSPWTADDPREIVLLARRP